MDLLKRYGASYINSYGMFSIEVCDRRSRGMPASRLIKRLVNSMLSRAAHRQNRLRSCALGVEPVFAQADGPPRVPPEVPIRPIPGEPLPPPQPTEPSPGPPRPPEPVPPNAPEPIRPPDPKGFASFSGAAATLHCCSRMRKRPMSSYLSVMSVAAFTGVRFAG
jgi:hypothetical protein